MALRRRAFSIGAGVGPAGDPTTVRELRAVAVARYPTNGGEMLLPEVQRWPIDSGMIDEEAVIIAGAVYEFTLWKNGQQIGDPFRGGVADIDGPITLASIYADTGAPPDPDPTILRDGDLLTRLSSNGATAGQRPTADGAGGLSFEDPVVGSGDMTRAEYDPDHDGKVTSAETADAVAWAGITDKPATFPASTHNHDDRYYTEAEVDTALGLKASAAALTAHTGNTGNPHGVTKAQIGLGNVDNTSDAAKPISTATQAALTALDIGNVGLHPYCEVTDRKANGTHGGTFIGGSPQQHVFNTVVNNWSSLANGVLLSGNLVTLEPPAAGTFRYHVSGWFSVSDITTAQARLFVNGVDTGLRWPMVDWRATSVNRPVFYDGYIDVPAGASKTVGVYGHGDATISTVGFGNAAAFDGEMEIYAFMSIQRLKV